MDPIKDSRTKFIFYTRRKPFTISDGDLLSVECKDDGIVARFKVNKSCSSYDAENDRVYVCVVDANKKPLMEGWVPMENMDEREGNLWLREKN